MKKSIITLVFCLLFFAALSQETVDCYTVIVGKNASFDGSVLMAHNEDDSGERMLINWRKVSGRKYNKTDSLELLNGTKIEQASKTFSYLWLQVTKQKFADAYMNENSVVICSNACYSKEDSTSGQISYYLRQILAERSESARHAVLIAGEIIDTLGYEHSGRTYCIADKNEAWMFSVVKGKHWVAQRIPDDHVAIIPNYYTIQEVNLEDSANFMASKNLIEYAVERTWYKYDSVKVFNFREVYGNPQTNRSKSNIPRHLAGINKLSEKQYTENEIIPFSFVPKQNVNLEDLKSILTDHYEQSEYKTDSISNSGNPHGHDIPRICNKYTQFSFIAQLRSNFPDQIGSLLWISPYNGCINPYIPVYLGIKNTPENFRYKTIKESQGIHFSDTVNSLVNFPDHAYYIINAYVKYIEEDYHVRIKEALDFKTKIEYELKHNQNKLEKSVLDVYNSYPDDARKILTQYCNGYLQRLVDQAKKFN